MNYKTNNAYGFWFGLLMGIIVFSLCFWGIGYSLDAGDKVLKIMLYIPTYLFLAIYIFLMLGAINLSYRVEEKELIIKWGLIQIKIPWADVNDIIQVEGKSNLFSLFGSSWPGYMVGLYSAKGLGAARMFATRPDKGFIYLKTNRGFYGLTPADNSMIKAMSEKTGIDIEIINMEKMSEEIKGKNMQEDRFYKLLFNLNVFFLVLFAGYLVAFFPGSGAPRFVILLLVLAVALFFFSIGNAGRLYQFSQQGGYFLLLLGVAVTGIFLILSLSEITLK